MESEIITLLTNLLLATPGFTNVMGAADACKLYGGIAPESAVMPYAVYRVDESAQVTKDGAGEYDVMIVLVFEPNKYHKCLEMKNVVKSTLGNDMFSYGRANTAYVEEMDAYVSIVYFTIINK